MVIDTSGSNLAGLQSLNVLLTDDGDITGLNVDIASPSILTSLLGRTFPSLPSGGTEKVWCVADLGLVLDPANVKAQMMSGIVYGLSQALGQEITFGSHEVEQYNFYDYDAMRMHQCPEIMVELLENSRRMGGAGEPGTPPSTPALANAIYAATGKRISSMPLSHAIDFA